MTPAELAAALEAMRAIPGWPNPRAVIEAPTEDNEVDEREAA